MAAILVNRILPSFNFARNCSFFLRYLNSSHSQNAQGNSVLPIWSHKVHNFGELSVFSGNIGLHFAPGNLWHGEENIVSVSLVGEELLTSAESFKRMREYVSAFVCNVKDESSQVEIRTDGNKILQNYTDAFLANLKLLIEIPHSYDIVVNCSTASPITIEKLENNRTEIATEGSCALLQLKSELLKVNTVLGDISGQTSLIGNMALKTGNKGCVNLGKVQGNNIEIRSEDGDVKIDSLYGGSVMINTMAGCVDVGDAHGDVKVTTSSGNIKCGSILGLLEATTDQGNIEVKVTSGGNISATSLQGNAKVKLDTDVKCKLHLTSKSLDIASELQISKRSEQKTDDLIALTGLTHGTGEQNAKVKCHNGGISLLQESWFVMPES